GGGAPQNPEIVVNGKKPHNPQCEPAEGFQGWVEWGAGWGSELADDAATAAAFTGNEEIAAPAEAISWAFTGVKTVSQLSRGDTHGAAATVAAATASSLIGKANKIFPIGGKGQEHFNSALSSGLGRIAGPTFDAAFSCE